MSLALKKLTLFKNNLAQLERVGDLDGAESSFELFVDKKHKVNWHVSSFNHYSLHRLSMCVAHGLKY